MILISHVDGNAVTGALSQALGRAADTITLRCAVCDDRHLVAETRVYLRCPGQVVRCPRCEACEITLLDRPGGVQLTLLALRGMDFA